MKRAYGSIALTTAALLGVIIAVILLCSWTLLLALTGDDGSWAGFDAAAAIKGAVARDEQGELVIRSTPALARFQRDFPSFWYLVWDNRTVLKYGPVPEHASASTPRLSTPGAFAEFVAKGETLQLVRSAASATTTAGNLSIEVGGVAYDAVQLAMSIVSDTYYTAIPVGIVFVGAIVAALVIVPMLVARPVRRVAAAAELIDGSCEGVRLPERGAPSELIPIVSAFNRALDRIDAVGAEQRRFLSNAAHELRTPLARARTRVESVDDTILKSALVQDLHSLSSTVTMLLQLARLSSVPTGSAEIDLAAVAARVAADHVPAALASGRNIAFSRPAEPIKVNGSAVAISIALSNIIGNALRYSRLGQRVLIEIDAPATVRVVDHGPGIAPEDKAVVCEPFVRGRRDGGDGTGLGLAIVAQVMALHKGILAIEDTPNGGTTVVLTFPPLSVSCGGHGRGWPGQARA
jgi:signal transduction histidine kinase